MGQANLGDAADETKYSGSRIATRFEPTRREAEVSWRESRDGTSQGVTDLEDCRQFALLVDISQSGASIALDRVLGPGEGVWLRLEGEADDEWTQAEVVGVTTTAQGPHLIRLAFRAPCPFETLQAAICG